MGRKNGCGRFQGRVIQNNSFHSLVTTTQVIPPSLRSNLPAPKSPKSNLETCSNSVAEWPEKALNLEAERRLAKPLKTANGRDYMCFLIPNLGCLGITNRSKKVYVNWKREVGFASHDLCDLDWTAIGFATHSVSCVIFGARSSCGTVLLQCPR